MDCGPWRLSISTGDNDLDSSIERKDCRCTKKLHPKEIHIDHQMAERKLSPYDFRKTSDVLSEVRDNGTPWKVHNTS